MSQEKETYEKIEHPAHYNKHPSGVECITIIQHYTFNVGSAIKYLWRQGLKPGEEDLEDLRKAKKYIEFEIALREHKKNPVGLRYMIGGKNDNQST